MAIARVRPDGRRDDGRHYPAAGPPLSRWPSGSRSVTPSNSVRGHTPRGAKTVSVKEAVNGTLRPPRTQRGRAWAQGGEGQRGKPPSRVTAVPVARPRFTGQ